MKLRKAEQVIDFSQYADVINSHNKKGGSPHPSDQKEKMGNLEKIWKNSLEKCEIYAIVNIRKGDYFPQKL